LPASKLTIVSVIVFVLLASTVFSASPSTTTVRSSNVLLSPTLSSSLGAALQWLAGNQSSSGSYGAYEEQQTAAAAYALWLNDSTSQKVALSYSWLATQLNSSSAWFWGTEADFPGVMLYSIAAGADLHLINTTSVEANLLQLQQPHSGFEGYYDFASSQTVTSSVDTDMALLGLISSGLIPAENETSAVQYLHSLQNPDGSFNLTSTMASDPIYSLGPDPISITALTVLTLRSANFPSNDPYVSKALAFLNKTVSTGFNGHVYAAAIADLVFKAYDQPDNVISSAFFILSQQNCDGGFSDTTRDTYPQSNALDTGWVATALETQFPGENGNALVNSHRVNCPPIADFQISPSTPYVGTAVHFNASMSHDADTDQVSYNWTFGDGSRAQGLSPTHTYSQAGNFTVTLTVADSGTNPGPLSDTKSSTVTVNPTVVQNSSTLTLGSTGLWIIVGIAGLVAITGVAFYLGRRSVKMRAASS
jgi:PKD repeat protein